MPRARRWIAANMATWAVGMPILFAGMDVAFRRASLLAIVATIAVSLVVAGGAVGAIHGRTLLRFSEEAASSPD